MGRPARTGSETQRSCTLRALECGSEAATLCMGMIHLTIIVYYNILVMNRPLRKGEGCHYRFRLPAHLPTCPSAYPKPSSTELAQI